MPQLHPLDVVRGGPLPLGHCRNLLCRDEEEFRLLVNEAPDEPGTGNPVDVGILSRDPLHSCTSFLITAGKRKYGWRHLASRLDRDEIVSGTRRDYPAG